MTERQHSRGWVLVVILGAAYVAAFEVVHQSIGDAVLALSLIPIVLAAWFYGRLGGIVVGVALIVVSIALMQTLGHQNGFRPVQLLRATIAILLATAVGWARESERRLRHLFEAAPDGLLVANRSGKIVMLNRQIEQLFGYTRSELVGQPIEVLVPHQLRDAHVGDRDKYLSAPQERLMGVTAPALAGRRKDGSEFPVDVSLAPQHGPDGVRVIAAIRDASERRALAETQRKLDQECSRRAASEEASRMKSTFIGLISHEIKTPLTALKVHLRVLLNSHRSSLTPVQKDAVTAIERSSKRLTKLVDSILEYSRVEATTLSLRNEELDPMAIVDEAILESQSLAVDKQLRLVGRCEGNVPPLRSDGTFIRIIVTNLIENAIKFTERGVVEVTTGISEGMHFFAVRDSGPGIPPTEQLRVFEPFAQLGSVEHKHSPGVGLGLTLVKRLTAALGGQVELESQVGEGSLFRVRIPSSTRTSDAEFQVGNSITATADERSHNL